MTLATIPGYPRIGKKRELKRSLEGYWAGKIVARGSGAGRTRDPAGELGSSAPPASTSPVNDFSFYDQVLDTAALVGAVPERYGWSGEKVDLDTYFAMARGRAGSDGVRALDMTKWFDTNYHYLVPELTQDQQFRLASDQPFAALREARDRNAGATVKVTLLGPVSFLLLSQADGDFSTLGLLDRLVPVYAEVVSRLADQGAAWIQFDESCFVQDRSEDELSALGRAYSALAEVKGAAKLVVSTAYGHVGESYQTLAGLPVDAIGLDLVRGAANLDLISRHGFPTDKTLIAGVIDGRNVWADDLDASWAILESLTTSVPADRLHVSSSCSLLHVPLDVRMEDQLDPEIASWLAFAEQKLDEIVTLTRALDGKDADVADAFARAREVRARAAASPVRRNAAVRDRLAALPSDADRRAKPFDQRASIQAERLHLPPLPTTTIGSFPQTGTVRAARRRFEKGEISSWEYEGFLEAQIRETVAEQEALGLDVLVHGEPERNDMVQYFGEQLDGFAFTRHGWVQSFGSRYVRPPMIVGDVARTAPMTVRWATFAQSLSDRPVKGMLTGPVTILNWSFVRDDQPRSVTCAQIALAIRDEVADLDAAGIAAIQIDEPALREGLPLRHAEWDAYLDWAVRCFRLAAAGARPETQIHTHMCYSAFGDVIDAISALDADVISIENARSDLALLGVFRDHGYDKGVGPGVYDIHSPRVPPVDEFVANLRATLTVLAPDQVWVNPDCGLKTRTPAEAHAALANMVAAAQTLRAEIA